MNVRYAVALILSAPAYADTITPPEWVGKVDNLLVTIEDIRSGLQENNQLYSQWVDLLTALGSDFQNREQERDRLFTTVRDVVNSLKSTNAASAKELEEKTNRIIVLEAEVAGQRQYTAQEVQRLTNLIGEVGKQLDDTRQAYATLVTMNGEKAEALINELTLLKQTYQAQKDARENFLAKLDNFTNATRLFISRESLASQNLGIELVGPTYPNQPA